MVESLEDHSVPGEVVMSWIKKFDLPLRKVPWALNWISPPDATVVGVADGRGVIAGVFFGVAVTEPIGVGVGVTLGGGPAAIKID